jgi:alkyl sulfatase BDS1-like metallo-beta-lactamase superfamily hydrolase
MQNRIGPLIHIWVLTFILLVLSPCAFAQRDFQQSLQSERDKTLSHEFRKELVEVAEGVHVAVGYGAGNSVLLEGRDGVVIVDTMLGTEAAEEVRDAFHQITDKPVKLIIYTHRHSDHVGGATVFARGFNPDIYARSKPVGTLPGFEKLTDVLKVRAKRQFGSELPLEDKIDGIAPVYRPTGGVGAGKLPPTHTFDEERKSLSIAGIDIELVAASGETDDHLFVWLPEKEVLICGDNFYMSFPNLYALRGTAYRDVSLWVSSLNKIIHQDAKYLISGHARPISGRENVRKTLTDYRDGIEYVLNETLRGMNEGLSPDELAYTIRLPEHLAGKVYLREYYGVIQWAVRSIYDGHLGWFDGNPTNLFPLSPFEEAKRMAALVGSEEALVETAQTAIASGEFQWACQLLDHLMVLDPDSRKAQTLKAEALRHLADQQMSSNARHYYLAVARELMNAD